MSINKAKIQRMARNLVATKNHQKRSKNHQKTTKNPQKAAKNLQEMTKHAVSCGAERWRSFFLFPACVLKEHKGSFKEHNAWFPCSTCILVQTKIVCFLWEIMWRNLWDGSKIKWNHCSPSNTRFLLHQCGCFLGDGWDIFWTIWFSATCRELAAILDSEAGWDS